MTSFSTYVRAKHNREFGPGSTNLIDVDSDIKSNPWEGLSINVAPPVVEPKPKKQPTVRYVPPVQPPKIKTVDLSKSKVVYRAPVVKPTEDEKEESSNKEDEEQESDEEEKIMVENRSTYRSKTKPPPTKSFLSNKNLWLVGLGLVAGFYAGNWYSVRELVNEKDKEK